MIQCRQALKPDGLFLSAFWGGDTLQVISGPIMTTMDTYLSGTTDNEGHKSILRLHACRSCEFPMPWRSKRLKGACLRESHPLHRCEI